MSTGATALAAPSTLVGLLWPSRDDARFAALRAAVLMVVGSALLTISAKVQVPLPYVPMTLQTLVVLMIGAAYGWRLGAALSSPGFTLKRSMNAPTSARRTRHSLPSFSAGGSPRRTIANMVRWATPVPDVAGIPSSWSLWQREPSRPPVRRTRRSKPLDKPAWRPSPSVGSEHPDGLVDRRARRLR